MPGKKKTKLKKIKITTKRRGGFKRSFLKFIKNNKWRTAAIFLIILFSIQVFFNYSFTGKRIALKLGEWMGFNEKHDFEGRNIFEVNGITYVAYEHPLVVAKIIVDPSCVSELCDIESLKRQILTNLTPAIQFSDVNFESAEGKRLIAETNAKAVPAFVFDQNIRLLANFEFIKDFFVEHENYYLLKTPPGRFIATPHNEMAHSKGGSENPTVTITIFSSFSCQLCSDMHFVLNAIADKYPNDVSLRFIHFNRGGFDNHLIQASECAAEQGKFWQMHDALFARQNDFTILESESNFTLLSELADTVELDPIVFEMCLADTGRFTTKLQNMQKVVADFGIKASPSLFVNNSFTEGFLNKDQISEKVEKALNPPTENVAQDE